MIASLPVHRRSSWGAERKVIVVSPVGQALWVDTELLRRDCKQFRVDGTDPCLKQNNCFNPSFCIEGTRGLKRRWVVWWVSEESLTPPSWQRAVCARERAEVLGLKMLIPQNPRNGPPNGGRWLGIQAWAKHIIANVPSPTFSGDASDSWPSQTLSPPHPVLLFILFKWILTPGNRTGEPVYLREHVRHYLVRPPVSVGGVRGLQRAGLSSTPAAPPDCLISCFRWEERTQLKEIFLGQAAATPYLELPSLGNSGLMATWKQK